MSDPLDHPPADHGSDRYDYVEVQGPHDPPAEVLAAVLEPCPDCRANAFIKYVEGDPTNPASWHITVAHDDNCPELQRHEGRDSQ